MIPREAVDWVDPQRWRKTPVVEKLRLLEYIRENLARYADELVQTDCEMKKIPQADDAHIHQEGTALQSTVVPVGNHINACINLYRSLADGKMPVAPAILRVDDERYDIHVFPQDAKDRALYFDRRDYLRVRGKPVQANPNDQPGGIIGVLGA